MSVTPRLVLQLFGTDCMRNGFFDGIWVSLVKQQILENPNTNWVIPDVRFPNEVKMIQSVQGQVWQVRRGDLPIWFMDKRDNNVEPIDVHPSEWAWAQTKFTQIIENNNQALIEEKEKLNSGKEALEGVARLELGMIKPGETFYVFKDPTSKNTAEGK